MGGRFATIWKGAEGNPKAGTNLSFEYVLGSNLMIRKKWPIKFQSFISRAQLKEDKLSQQPFKR